MSSEDPKETDHLSNRGIDYLVSALRSGIGILPIYGSFLAELVTVTIPNQRLDRIANYARALAKRLARFEKSFLDEQAKRSDFCELVEESFHQAARSTTEERREYIANLIANGLREDQEDYLRSRFLLRILGQLNDAEILILHYYGLGHSQLDFYCGPECMKQSQNKKPAESLSLEHITRVRCQVR